MLRSLVALQLISLVGLRIVNVSILGVIDRISTSNLALIIYNLAQKIITC